MRHSFQAGSKPMREKSSATTQLEPNHLYLAARSPQPSITISESLMGGDPDFGEQKSFSAIYLNSPGVLS
ncbi:MAG: hypothetical protein HY254_16635 [Burkholderiales bacterium]|nr:hypothetical protein [Burkholderiales bacterium]